MAQADARRFVLLPIEVRGMPKAPLFVNKILSALTADDLRLLTPHLKPVDLPLRKHLETARRLIDEIYFPDSGLCLLWPMARPINMSKSG